MDTCMDTYINNYKTYDKINVYVFNLCEGGIGDYIKFFMHALMLCVKNKERLYYRKGNLEIEKYIKLKYAEMYIDDDKIKELNNPEIIKPHFYYSVQYFDFIINISDVFYFTEEIKINCELLFPKEITTYISVHVRLGDKHLETEKLYIQCPDDERHFSEEKMYKFIEDSSNKHIFFCCDNNAYKLKIKERYNNIITINSDIGHTALYNTTPKQVLDAITEFYILANSKMIYSASFTGFSFVASKINNIPFLQSNIH